MWSFDVKVRMNERRVHENSSNESSLNYYLKDKWKLGITLFCLFSFITMVRFKKENRFY
jgi:hypothetical protein